MSYADNLSSQFGQLGLGGSQPYHSPPPPDSGQQGQYGYHSTSQDGAYPPQHIASPPQPSYQPPSDKPPLPQGWIALFDQNYREWYYVNTETNRTQWEFPGSLSSPQRPPMETYPSEESRGSGSSPYPPAAPYGQTAGGYGGPPRPPPSASYGSPAPPPSGYGAPSGQYGHSSQGSYGGEGRSEKEKKSSGKSGLLLGAAGGVAAGLVGGALLHHALEDDSSDEEERRHETVIVNEYNTTTYNEYDNYEDPYRESGPPGILPARDEEGNYVSESDRESVQEAREDYEEALARVEDSSSPSSSDYEELAEAREEYEEEYEETYDD